MTLSIHQLFDQVVDLPAGQQRDALEKLTQDQLAIVQVLRMCGHAHTDATVISSVISTGANNLAESLSNELKAGDTLDTWKLIEKIGQGGMGSVFLAERADGHFQQTVAIKVMHGLPTPSATARLSQERQILAGFTHPNIARLFDGGATPNGQPYLVLEYIKGLAIDAYCQSQKLGFVQVLELMLPICDAVAIAHQRLIIHCDIKPANILVSQAGRPSLLDFGIANLAGEADLRGTTQLSEVRVEAANAARNDAKETAHFTQNTMRGPVAVAYTPRYASPEQIAGKLITTATDIYSLGRVLEELCANDPAFRRNNARGKAGLQCEELQAIIDKACAEIPAARYGSAENLGAELKNVLRGAKVAAAATVPGYQSRKWMSQHWLKAVAVLVSLVVVSGFTLKVIAEKNRAELQAVNAETERRKAEIERKKAELERAKAETERAAAEAERAKAEAQRLTATQARKVAELAQRETQVAKGVALQQRDIAHGARNVAEDARKQAVSAQQIAQQERDRVVLANKSAETINNFLISIFEGVNPSAGGNRNASAREIITAAEKKLGAVENALPEAQGELFKSLAFIYENLGDKKISAAYNLRAADAFGLAGRDFVRKRIYSLTLASGNLSRIEPEKAAALAQQAVGYARLHKEAEPRAYAASLNALILGFHAAKQYADAKPVIEEGRAIYKDMGGNPWTIAGYPVFHYNATMNLYHLGQYAQAETAIREQIAYRLTVVPVFEQLLIAAYQLLAKTLQAQRKNDEAAATFALALARAEKHFGQANPTHTELLSNYNQFLKETGRSDTREKPPSAQNQ